MKNTIAFITGANKGIGFETARQLAMQGVTVILGGRSLEAAQAAAARITASGLKVDAVQLDVTDETSIKRAAELISQRYGRLDILVNNAGIMKDAFDASPSAQKIETWRETFDTNLFGLVSATQAFLPLLRKSSKGRIVNVSSVLGSMAANVDPTSDFYNFKIPAYNISKTAVNAWTVHLAYELAGEGIKVNAAHPGFVKTDLHGVDAPVTPEDGALTSVRLSLLPDDGPTGKFFHGDDELAW